MGKDNELLQAVKDQDVVTLHKLLHKLRGSKSSQLRKKLIGSNKKLNINHQDEDGMAALHQAALMGNTDIMRVLLESGAAVDIKDNKEMRPLHYAAWQGKESPVKILLMWRATANEPALDGDAPLHLACQHGHFEVVNMLMQYKGDPTMVNKNNKTPLDLACEFGRYKVAELLIESNLCSRLLLEGPDDMADNTRTTPLHLAAKNGHADIIKLLLKAGMNINRQTHSGTCLHEAALYGKTEVVRLLLDCGIDVNRPNSYDQTALDIVNKFTTSRAARELKQLLKESAYVVLARAIKDYHSVYDPRALSFHDGDYIKVVEQRADGVWKGQLMTESGHLMGKTGYFPSSAVVLVDRQALVNGPLCGSMNSQRRLMTPQVPDLLNRTSNFQQQNSQDSGLTHHLQLQPPTKLSAHELALYNSVGTDNSFPPPPSPLVTPKSPSKDDSDRDSGISPQQHYPPQGFPGQGYYHHQQPSPTSPDQGDWYQRHVLEDGRSSGSPRDSPGSSNRNSSASTGSGGYLPSHNYVNLQITSQHRLSGQSYESGVSSSRQSYHSNSSSSLGSLDRLEESGYSSTVNVHELFQAGYSDSEVLRAWLADLHFDEYYNLFIQAAYDMPTISRMTPEDLTAIGITKPAHRKRLKAEISKLNIHDGIPDFKPANVHDWVRLLNLEFYYETLVSQGYNSIDNVTDITWEDLEEIGINKLGHQKKIMLAVERLKRIENVSRRLSSLERKPSVEMLEPPSAYPTPQWLDRSNKYPSQEMYPKRSPSGENLSEMRTFQREDSPGAVAGRYQPDVVAIQVNRGTPTKNTGNLQVNTSFTAPSSGEGSPRTYQSFQGPFTAEQERSLGALDLQGHDPPPHRSSLDDLDGSATLRRPSAMVSPRIKPKPVAKIIAKSKRMSKEVTSTDIIKVDTDVEFKPGYSGTLGRKSTFTRSEPIYDSPGELRTPHSPKHVCTSTPPSSPSQHSPNSQYGGTPSKGKKAPPPPPKRTNSMKSDAHPGHHGELHRANSSPGPPVPSPKPVHLTQQASTPSSPGPNHATPASPQHQPQQVHNQPPQQQPSSQGHPPEPPVAPKPAPKPNVRSEQLKRQGSDTSTDSLPEPPQDYSPCDEEEFPPPPPPLDTEHSSPKQGPHPPSAAEVKRNPSTTSIDSTTSVSSTESNTLPFANENVGTIKQRNPPAKPSIVSVSGEEEEKNVDLNSSLFDQEFTDTIKRNPKNMAGALMDSPSHSGDARKVPPPTPKRRESIGSSSAGAAALEGAQATFSGGKDSGDVLNDIGNMLQDLTDELDAMLEFELNS